MATNTEGRKCQIDRYTLLDDDDYLMGTDSIYTLNTHTWL